MGFDARLGCSTISFRRQELAPALETIAGLGFTEVDLGALPGVCDHVPYVLDGTAVREVAATVGASGLTVRSINCDIGDLNVPVDGPARDAQDDHLDRLLDLAVAAGAPALVLPCGALTGEPTATVDEDIALVATRLIEAADRARNRDVAVWVESLHFFRLCGDLDRATRLADRLAGSDVGIVMDFSHVVASGAAPEDFVDRFVDRITHVHIRDAKRGDINLSVGNGDVDFASGLDALAAAGYSGHFSLELETRDVTEDERPAAAAAAARTVTALLDSGRTTAITTL